MSKNDKQPLPNSRIRTNVSNLWLKKLLEILQNNIVTQLLQTITNTMHIRTLHLLVHHMVI